VVLLALQQRLTSQCMHMLLVLTEPAMYWVILAVAFEQ
jgi:hypothetical protein